MVIPFKGKLQSLSGMRTERNLQIHPIRTGTEFGEPDAGFARSRRLRIELDPQLSQRLRVHIARAAVH